MLKIVYILSTYLFLFIGNILAIDIIVYSGRHYDVDKQIADLFYQKTGNKIIFVNASNDILLSKLELSKNEKADILITTDAYSIIKAKNKNLLEPFKSKLVDTVVNTNLKDKDNTFTAFTKRYRVIVYNTKKVNINEISSYADLADNKWNKKIMLRASNSSYDIFFIANLINVWGIDKTQKYLKNLLTNTVQKPYGKDREQIIAVASNFADLSIVNSYYYGQVLNSKDEKEKDLLKNIKLFFPNSTQDIKGSHVNISAIGVLKQSKNKKEALDFIEFLLSPEIQELIMNTNYEHPINKAVKLNSTLVQFGIIKETVSSIEDISKHYQEAIKLIENSNW
jgi:iron(III) transport system substrate-binding protein